MPPSLPPARSRQRRVSPADVPASPAASASEPGFVRIEWRRLSQYLSPDDVPAFGALAEALESEFQPRSAYEAVLVEDMAVLTWEAHAFRRTKKNLLDVLRGGALATILKACIYRGISATQEGVAQIEAAIPSQTARSLRGDPDAIAWVNQLLADGGRSRQEIDGSIFKDNVATLTAIEKLIVVNEQRREGVLAELERRQLRRLGDARPALR